jgi:hypothetical protein
MSTVHCISSSDRVLRDDASTSSNPVNNQDSLLDRVVDTLCAGLPSLSGAPLVEDDQDDQNEGSSPELAPPYSYPPTKGLDLFHPDEGYDATISTIMLLSVVGIAILLLVSAPVFYWSHLSDLVQYVDDAILSIVSTYIMERPPQPVASHWSLLSPTFCLFVTVSYICLASVGYWRYVLPSSPTKGISMHIPRLVLIYNCLVVAASAYIAWRVLSFALYNGYTLACNMLSPDHMELTLLWYLFYLHTVVMIIRKKKQQLSFLHVYHHSTVVIACWLGCVYLPGGDLFLVALLNSLGHVLLYSHYSLALLGYRCYWKKHITELQIIQFLLFISQITYQLYSDCLPASRTFSYLFFAYVSSFVVLFSLFYRQQY